MKKILLVLIIALSVISFCSCAREDNGVQEEMFNKVMSADEALEMSMKTDTVVFEMKGCTSGQKVWDEFCAKTAKGKKASVLCANYYVLDLASISRDLYEEEKDYYPQLYFSLIEFDGKNYPCAVFVLKLDKGNTSHSDMLSSLAELPCTYAVHELIA